MNFCKKVFHEFVTRFRYIINSTRAELNLAGTVITDKIDKTTRVVIGGTTYLVCSFFKKDAKGNAVDKIKRLIEREAENIKEN